MANNENLEKAQGFDVHPENINKKGRPPSIKNQLKEILKKDGKFPISKTLLIKETEDNYIFKIPTEQALAFRLSAMAVGGGKDAFKALKLLLETFDGQAKQPIEVTPVMPITGTEIVDNRLEEDKT